MALFGVVLSSAQAPAIPADQITYIMPAYLGFTGAPQAQFADHLARLKALGTSPRVRTGFTAYVHIRMTDWKVDVSDPAALRGGMAETIASIDAAIARARANDIPIAITFWMPLRRGMDPVQEASQAEDVRNMQWHADNSLATGWWTHSQYARTQRHVMEAYIRELGRVVANRMALYPETLVAVTGDGEVELSHDAVLACQKLPAQQQPRGGCNIFADYSPFAVLEFRDWLTGRGLYAAGQPLAEDAYEHAARYRNDPAPHQDGNGDGRTLAGDFGTSPANPDVAAMRAWDLKHFHWTLTDEPPAPKTPDLPEVIRAWNAKQSAGSLADSPFSPDPRAIPDVVRAWNVKYSQRGLGDTPASPDPRAIPEAVRNAPQFNPLPATVANGFDPPRVFDKNDPWWRLWHEFRQQMVHRYNRDFAKWMTTSTDPATGTTVPSWRFYSDQIAADFLNGFTGESADPRFWVSASAWWTADTSPYGSIGITSFNMKYANAGDPSDKGDYWARTLAALGPELGKRNKRWGIIEWNPSAPEPGVPQTTGMTIYRQENELILKYRPNLLIPWALDYKESVRVWDTGFEQGLKELIQQLGIANP
ncbi:MAG: hypothetical protein WD227_13170 [Vicinamibacterales bacterium]